jgi:hypothetical protein
MSYGELILPSVWTGINKQTGRFLKGHVPANKGKKWSDYMGKRTQKRAMKGWKNLDLHRNKNGRPDTADRCRKQVIAVLDDGRWYHFGYVEAAAQWLQDRLGIACNRENIGRCCRCNQSRKRLKKPWGHPSDKVNTDHKYKGIRFYFESDNVWTTKIKTP